MEINNIKDLLNDYLEFGIITKDNLQTVLEEVFGKEISIEFFIENYDFNNCVFSTDSEQNTNRIATIKSIQDSSICLYLKSNLIFDGFPKWFYESNKMSSSIFEQISSTPYINWDAHNTNTAYVNISDSSATQLGMWTAAQSITFDLIPVSPIDNPTPF